MSSLRWLICAFFLANLFAGVFTQAIAQPSSSGVERVAPPASSGEAQELVVSPAASSGANSAATSDIDKRKEAREEADLVAQQEMASAARLMAWLTAGQILVALLTIVFIWLTFRQTRRTADAAVEAAKEAQVANVVGRSIATLELRAYISVEPEGVYQLVGETDAIGQVTVRNVGKLPARNVSVFVQMKIAKDRETDFPVADDPTVVDRVIQPGAEMRQGGDRHETMAAVRNPGNYVYVWGIVYYDDGYHKRRFTRFCHRYSAASYDRQLDDLLTGTTRDGRCLIAKDKARYHTEGNNAD